MATLMPIADLDPRSHVDVGDREILKLNVTGDASYATGGYDLLPEDLPFRVGNVLETLEGVVEGSGRKLEWDSANSKVIWREPDGTEIANATDLSAVTAKVTAYGR